MWCIMKAILILGNDLTTLNKGDPTVSVLGNKDAISVNQDPLGVQAKRIAVQMPRNTSITDSSYDNTAVVALCDSSRPTQKWFWTSPSYPRTSLYVAPCNSSDVWQRWSFYEGMLQNAGNKQCVDATAPYDPAPVHACNSMASTQKWVLQSSGHVENLSTKDCLDVYNFAGPDVQIYPCKVPGQGDGNQVWTLNKDGTLFNSGSKQCLSVGLSNPGSVLSTYDSQGTHRCLQNNWGSEGGWSGVACDKKNNRPTYFHAIPKGRVPDNGPANYTLASASGSPQWNNQVGASGPWPGSRYIFGYSWDNSAPTFEFDLKAAEGKTGSTVVASDHLGIINDNLVGKVTRGGNFCLDLVTGGLLEVWTAPLTNGRVSVALFNRSPAEDNISLDWTVAGLKGKYTVYDIWAAETKGVYQNNYSATVAAHAAAFLILTPA